MNMKRCGVKNAILQVKGLIKSYHQKLVPPLRAGAGFSLDIPSLEFEKGRIYSLLGPNGAGKTTLLKLLSGVEKPDKGKIFYKEKRIDFSSLNYRRRIGLVMQNPFLFHTTVYNNVAYGLKVRSRHKKGMREVVRKSLELVGLSGFESKGAYQLSSGEAQRVALARALAIKPEILFLDEPTANIDRRNTEIIEKIIREINVGGVTIILATHNFSQAYSLSHEVISFLDGKPVETSPENLFSGTIEATDGLKRLALSPQVKVILATEKAGRAHISIAPEDIILSRQPLDSSARNSFSGRITRISGEGQKVRLYIDTGCEFVSLVTKASFREMGLNIDSRVYLTFKTSAVKVY